MHSLTARRNYGLGLAETRCIDEHAYRKARYKLFQARSIEQVDVVVGWLEAQPEWKESEWHAPEFVRAEIRDQELLQRECAEARKGKRRTKQRADGTVY